MTIECGALRKIGLEISRGDSGGDVYISSVDDVQIEVASFEQEKHWIGGSGHGLIARCRRCVGNPNRKCDLNTETWTDLEPQTQVVSS